MLSRPFHAWTFWCIMQNGSLMPKELAADNTKPGLQVWEANKCFHLLTMIGQRGQILQRNSSKWTFAAYHCPTWGLSQAQSDIGSSVTFAATIAITTSCMAIEKIW